MKESSKNNLLKSTTTNATLNSLNFKEIDEELIEVTKQQINSEGIYKKINKKNAFGDLTKGEKNEIQQRSIKQISN